MPSTRLAGYVLIVCAIAALLLLAAHPGGEAHDLQGLVKMEAAQQARNGLVHGGFILLLPLIVACQVELARVLGLDRFAALAGLMLFCAGCAFLAASMPLGLGMQALGAAGLALAALRLRRAIAATGLLVCLVTLAGVVTLPQQPIMLMVAVALIAVVWNAVGGALLLMAARARLR
jgi:hypothetical protein